MPQELVTSFADYNGHNLQLNTGLIIQKNMVQKQVDILLQLHKDRFDIEDSMTKSNDVGELGILAEYWHMNQCQLQEAWGFTISRDYHSFWLMPKCSCPILDNKERLGTGNFIIDKDCLIHGWD